MFENGPGPNSITVRRQTTMDSVTTQVPCEVRGADNSADA